jgi:hypothetical protein
VLAGLAVGHEELYEDPCPTGSGITVGSALAMLAT